MNLNTKENYEIDPDFKEAAKPLAHYLASLHLNDPTHKFVLADLYDLVNEVRDATVKEARDTIEKISARSDFLNSALGRSRLISLRQTIARCEGETDASRCG